jgi:hypothetical protein
MWIRIRDPASFDPGSGMEIFGSGIRDKHAGSATLIALHQEDPLPYRINGLASFLSLHRLDTNYGAVVTRDMEV